MSISSTLSNIIKLSSSKMVSPVIRDKFKIIFSVDFSFLNSYFISLLFFVFIYMTFLYSFLP